MRDQNRTDWQRFYSAGLYIDPKDPRTLIIKPKDSEFKSVLDAAGVPDIAETGQDNLGLGADSLRHITQGTDNKVLTPEEDKTAIDKFLADLKNLRN